MERDAELLSNAAAGARSRRRGPAIRRGWGWLSLLTLALAGCASDPRANNAQPPEPAPGLKYYAAKDVVVIDAAVTESLGNHITAGLALEPRVTFKSAEALVTLKTVPDPARAYTLELKTTNLPAPEARRDLFRNAARDAADAEAAKDAPPAVAVGGDGLLTSVSAQGGEKPGETLADPARFPLGAAGGAGRRVDPDPEKVRQVFDLTESGAALKGREKEYAEALKRFGQLPLPLLYLLQESQEARELWDRQAKLDGLIASHLVERDTLLDRITKLDRKADVDVSRTQMEAMTTEIEALRKQRDGADAAFQASLDRVLASRAVGTTDHARKEVVTLDLGDLPPSETFRDMLKSARSAKDVEAGLSAGYPRAAEAFRRTRVLVTIGGMPDYRYLPGASAATQPAGGAGTPGNPAGRARLYFREALPVVLGVYALAVAPGADPLSAEEAVRLVEEKRSAVLHPRVPVTGLLYDAKVLAANGLQLAFNAQGRLTGLVRAGAGPAPADAATARALRDADALVNRLLAERKNELGQLQGQIESLRRRKDMTDAKVVLQGETANADLLAQQTLLQAQLNGLLSRQAAARARALGAASGADPRAQADELRAEIDLLRGRDEGGTRGSLPTTGP